MFENQLGLRENPFVSGHQAKYVYPSREHQEALAHLRYGIENREPFVLITGEVGTGKTTAIYDSLAEWGSLALVALITNSALTRSELIEEICLRFGVGLTPGISKPQALVQLERYLQAVRGRGELAILLLDEAQNLDDGLLEEIRLLSNQEINGEKLVQIFLVGQPELEVKLARQELRQLRQRIAIHYRLRPLSEVETERYIHHRVSVAGGNAAELFPHDTCRMVFRLTNGIPREINTVAGQALLNAFVDDSRSVRPAHVKAMATETEFHSVLGGSPPASAESPSISPTPATAPAVASSIADELPPASTRRGMNPALPPEPFDTYKPGPLMDRSAASRQPSASDPIEPEPPYLGAEEEPAAPHLPSEPKFATAPPSYASYVEPEAADEFGEPQQLEPEYGEAPQLEPEYEELAAMTPEVPVAQDPPRIEAVPATPRVVPSTRFPAAKPPGGGQSIEEPPPADYVPPDEGKGFELPAWLDELAEQKRLHSSQKPVEAEAHAQASEPVEMEEPEQALPPAPPAPMAPPARPAAPARTMPSMPETPHFEMPGAFAAAPLGAMVEQRQTQGNTPMPFERPPLHERPPARIAPHPGHPGPSRTPEFVGSALPPRLRAKMDRDSGGSNRLVPLLAGVGAFIGVVLLAFMLVRFGPWSHGGAPKEPSAATTSATPEQAPVATTQTPTPAPVTPVTSAPPRTTVAPPRSTPANPKPAPTRLATTQPSRPVTTTPQQTQVQTPTTVPVTNDPVPTQAVVTPPVTTTPPAPTQLFGIIVGTYMTKERADEVSSTLAGKSGQPARVVGVTEDGAGVFRVVLGRFDDRGKAEDIASDLVGKGIINEARITSLGAK